jgi:hypothetical protein
MVSIIAKSAILKVYGKGPFSKQAKNCQGFFTYAFAV